MKKKIIVIHAALLLLAACASDGEPVITPPEAQHPLIAARLQANSGAQNESNTNKPGTRASVKPDYDDLEKGELFRWDKADKLALTIAAAATPGTATTWQPFNIDVSFDPETATKPGNADFTGDVPAAQTGDVLYGLSPYRADYGTNLAAVPLKVAATQTQTNADGKNGATSTAHLSSNILMYAKTTLTKDITATTSGSITLLPHLSFKHLCPLVRFRIRNASSTPWQVTKIEMRHSSTKTDNDKWFATSATYDLTAADVPAGIVSKVTARSQSMTLNVANCKVLTKNSTDFAPGNHLNAYIALLPTTAYTPAEATTTDYLSILITATINGSTPAVTEVMEYKVYYKDLEFLRGGLKPGLRYCFNLSIQADASIEGFEPGNGDDGQDIGVGGK